MVYYELATDIIFPNINVYRGYMDGEFVRYKIEPQGGYVMYDTTTENWEQTDPDSEPYLVTYYYTLMYCPVTYTFDNFTWNAVLLSEVENSTSEI